MGNQTVGSLLATDLFPEGPGSEPRQRGRRLTLHFTGEEVPVLHRIQFTRRWKEDATFLEFGHPTNGFSWGVAMQALSMFFVECLVWELAGLSGSFSFSGKCTGSPAAALGNAIFSSGPIRDLLFAAPPVRGKKDETDIRLIFGGDNVHGRASVPRDRQIKLMRNYLAPDCVEITWEISGPNPLRQIDDFRLLGRRLRLSLDLPVPKYLEDAKSQHEKPTVLSTDTSTSAPEATDSSKPESPLSTEKVNPSAEVTRPKTKKDTRKPGDDPGQSAREDTLRQLDSFRDLDHFRDKIRVLMGAGWMPTEIFDKEPELSELQGTTTRERFVNFCDLLSEVEFPSDGSLSSSLWAVKEPNHIWPDTMPIWTAGENVWTLEDVTHGTLILGATGSGKSSCSGRSLACAFLAKRFGGLVLTTKPGEADEWMDLCHHMNRGDDVRLVRVGGPLKLNFLAYETLRPGAGSRLAENFVGFVRVLASAIGNRQGQNMNEGFWRQTGNQLLRNLFETFQMAEIPMTLDKLADFVTAAPLQRADHNEDWREIPCFGEVLAAAADNTVGPVNSRGMEKVKHYWLVAFPKVPHETRGCIYTAFMSLLDVLRSRYIYELVSTTTTITPESVFNGSIIILDLPLKEYGDAGILVQCGFKYLFQRAIERRENHRELTRPAFLYIDEAQNFVTEYDATFQQTARSSRVATVLLSQNAPNFYATLGSGDHARSLFDSLAGNLSTRIFHANGCVRSNEWASKMIGHWDRPVSSISVSAPQNIQPGDTIGPHYSYGAATRSQPLVELGEFGKLRLSNYLSNYFSDAYIYRAGTLFRETGQPVIKATFRQYRIPKRKA